MRNTVIALCLLLLTAISSVAAHNSLPFINQRTIDSTSIVELRKKANATIKLGPYFISGAAQAQIIKTADALVKWTNTYFKPNCIQPAVAISHFRHLVTAGKYYEWGKRPSQAGEVYQQAELVIPKVSPLRAKAGDSVRDLIAGTSRISYNEYLPDRPTHSYSEFDILQSIEYGITQHDILKRNSRKIDKQDDDKTQDLIGSWGNTPETLQQVLGNYSAIETSAFETIEEIPEEDL